MTYDTFTTLIIGISVFALLYTMYIYILESSQPPIIIKLRNDLRDIKNDLLSMKNPEKELGDQDVLQLIRRLNPDYVYDANSTYTINKKYLYVCTKYDPNFSEKENYTIILFTLLHEVAHIMTPEYGHTKNFWQNFKVILEHARSIGVYTMDMESIVAKGDYSHCGLKIDKSYSPYD